MAKLGKKVIKSKSNPQIMNIPKQFSFVERRSGSQQQREHYGLIMLWWVLLDQLGSIPSGQESYLLFAQLLGSGSARRLWASATQRAASKARPARQICRLICGQELTNELIY